MVLGSTNANVIGLPLQGSDPVDGENLVVSGWGTQSEGGSLPAYLKIANVPCVSRAKCREQYGESDITDNMICAGLVGVGGVDACQVEFFRTFYHSLVLIIMQKLM
jgi:trypsin